MGARWVAMRGRDDLLGTAAPRICSCAAPTTCAAIQDIDEALEETRMGDSASTEGAILEVVEVQGPPLVRP